MLAFLKGIVLYTKCLKRKPEKRKSMKDLTNKLGKSKENKKPKRERESE